MARPYLCETPGETEAQQKRGAGPRSPFSQEQTQASIPSPGNPPNALRPAPGVSRTVTRDLDESLCYETSQSLECQRDLQIRDVGSGSS